MKSALIAAIVAAVVAAGSTGAALMRPAIQVKRVLGNPSTVLAGSTGFAWASCPHGYHASGGGLFGEPFSTEPLQLTGSYPMPDLNTWEITVLNPGTVPTTVRAAVTCIS